MIELARKSLEEMPSHEREISAVTVKVSPNGYEKIKNRIQDFRKELLQIAEHDDQVNQVAQINLQLFPVSKENIHE